MFPVDEEGGVGVRIDGASMLLPATDISRLNTLLTINNKATRITGVTAPTGLFTGPTTPAISAPVPPIIPVTGIEFTPHCL